MGGWGGAFSPTPASSPFVVAAAVPAAVAAAARRFAVLPPLSLPLRPSFCTIGK